MASLVLKLTGDGTNRVRGMIAPNNDMQVFSVYDFMTKACGYKDIGATARKEFKRLTMDGSEYKDEIVASCHNLHFPGQRGPSTPCMTIRGLQRLLMILGGKVAAEFRVMVEGVFTRVMAGDQSLIEVINANAASDAPVQQAYRQALAQEPVVEPAGEVLDVQSIARKRRIEELEIVRLEVEIESKKLANISMSREHLVSVTLQYRELCQDTVMDERARLMLKDSFLNMAVTIQQGQAGGQQQLLTNGVSPNKPISLSSVALELGLKIPDNEFIAIGREVSARYFQLNGRKPPKHEQLIRGKVTLVNSYMECDRPIVEEVLRAHAGGES